jgi:hypothetical protein
MKNRDERLINQIRNIRVKNNDQWMKLLRIAFEYCPSYSKKIMKEITKNDINISKLTKKLSEDKAP